MITKRVPDTWQDLQRESARILEECGLAVEVEKKVKTGRGEVEIDVYAEEEVKGRRYIILCECKHWRSRVPQQIVHGFRTVVGDIGANVGYLISTGGYQTGAFSAAELTKLELVDWHGFQVAFEETWYDNYLSPKIAQELGPLLTYAEPIVPRWFPDLSDDEKNKFIVLKHKYDAFGWLVMMFTPYVRMLQEKERPNLPLRNRMLEDEKVCRDIPDSILDVSGYREFYEQCLAYGLPAINEFRAIRDRNAT
jgi:restriction system protein